MALHVQVDASSLVDVEERVEIWRFLFTTGLVIVQIGIQFGAKQSTPSILELKQQNA